MNLLKGEKKIFKLNCYKIPKIQDARYLNDIGISEF